MSKALNEALTATKAKSHESKVDLLMRTLPDAQAADLREVLESPGIDAEWASRALSELGIDLSGPSIRRWRKAQ